MRGHREENEIALTIPKTVLNTAININRCVREKET